MAARRTRRRRSATWPWSATVGRARPPWPRRSSSPPGRSRASGRVEDGNTTTDFDPEEARRRISVSLALAPFEHDGHKVNVIDTPGYADFVSDVAAALRAADLAIFVVSAVEGVEVQTELVWRMADELGPPARVLRQQARPRARVVLADARRAQGQVRRRRRAAAAPHRRGSRLPRRRRAARRPRGPLRRRQGDRRADPARDGDGGALDPRRAHRGHRRRRRRPDGALPRRRDHPRRGARARARRRRRPRDRCSRCCAAARPS